MFFFFFFFKPLECRVSKKDVSKVEYEGLPVRSNLGLSFGLGHTKVKGDFGESISGVCQGGARWQGVQKGDKDKDTDHYVVHRTDDGGGVGRAEHPYLGKGRTMVREGKVK